MGDFFILVFKILFREKEIPMPLAKECEGMEVLISNYKDTSDMSVLRPYEARMYIR